MACMRGNRNALRVLVGKVEGRRLSGRRGIDGKIIQEM
jgi:hypothetical protein